ncbi:MAG: TolC family protein, partial [Verrucomicrobiota bacterium]|nr:TolC family protein [Verrucomicrobiota bacterium]
MIRTTTILTLVSALLVSCVQHRPRQQPREVFQRGEKWRHAPSWASASLRQDWWKSFRDSRLNSHLATALAHNPGLRVLSTRLERARAQTGQARAAAWPSINLSSGLVFGNEQTRMTRFSPTDLEPWASTGSVSWELDLFGRLHAGTRSAREAEQAAFWDLHAGRLLVVTRVADAHFRTLRLNEERSLIADSIAANRKIVEVRRERRKAGLLSDTELLRHEAEHESLTRSLLDLDRLRGLAHLQLETLCGGSSLPRTSSHLAAVRTPALPMRTTSAVMTRRPDLLAAESRVRSAFQLEESARLHLLPSLTLGAGASGESASLLSGFR